MTNNYIQIESYQDSKCSDSDFKFILPLDNECHNYSEGEFFNVKKSKSTYSWFRFTDSKCQDKIDSLLNFTISEIGQCTLQPFGFSPVFVPTLLKLSPSDAAKYDQYQTGGTKSPAILYDSKFLSHCKLR